VFDELNIPKVGTAYADPYLDLMFEEYNKPKSVYYVVENNGKVVGSAESPLENEAATICELQKMFFAGNARSGDRKSSDGCVLSAKDFDSKIVIWKRCLLCMMPKNYTKKWVLNTLMLPW
jgi:putative acetyltransferase